MAGPGIRGLVTTLAPGFFSGDNAQRYLFVQGLQLDKILQKLDEGIHDRMPIDAVPSALQYIGQNVGVRRGLTESDDSYRVRLQRALDDYRRAGNAWAVLAQVLGYLLAYTPAARTVQTYYDRSDGTPETTDWQQYTAGTALTLPPRWQRSDPADWNWDQYSPTPQGQWGWWRWYLVLVSVSPQNWTDPAPAWGSGEMWGEYSGSWGCTTSPEVGRSIVLIVGQWKSGYAHWGIVSFDAAEFRPAAVVNPDGYYGRWSKVSGGVYVRSRSANGRYFRLQ